MTRRADQSLAQFDEHPLGSVIYDAQHLAHDLHLVAEFLLGRIGGIVM